MLRIVVFVIIGVACLPFCYEIANRLLDVRTEREKKQENICNTKGKT